MLIRKDIWYSQPLRGMAAGNHLVGCAMGITGLPYERLREFAYVFKLPSICENHFYQKIQNDILSPVFHTNYLLQKDALIAAFKDKVLTLVGDGWCDSPGFSAKFGTYTLMDAGKIPFLNLTTRITVWIIISYGAGRLYGNSLIAYGWNIGMIGTDGSNSIEAMLKKHFAGIEHQFDVYHVAKRLRKQLAKTASGRD